MNLVITYDDAQGQSHEMRFPLKGKLTPALRKRLQQFVDYFNGTH